MGSQVPTPREQAEARQSEPSAGEMARLTETPYDPEEEAEGKKRQTAKTAKPVAKRTLLRCVRQTLRECSA